MSAQYDNIFLIFDSAQARFDRHLLRKKRKQGHKKTLSGDIPDSVHVERNSVLMLSIRASAQRACARR
ncbi:hypothetical protein [Symbiopectobacterium purcellii]|uniref:hypothetical protein n=1 Tax=Symbiopectobacterium purcellii TaxID=2871826 RepID=UPI003F835A9B